MRAFLYALLLLLALVTLASAQSDATTTAAATTGTNDATTTAAAETTADATTTAAATTDSDTASSDDSSATSASTESAASTTAAATTTGDASSTTSASQTTRSSATTTLGNTASSVRTKSDLPTLAGAGIPTVIVPDLSSAPFMQKSSYPEGTVFICVGAILGFLGMCILAWRAMIAYALHRSVKKAAMAQSMSDSKTMRGPGSTYGPGGAMYNAVGHGSTLSLDHLKSPHHGGPKSPLEKTRFAPSQSSLFFSPTADNPNRVSHYSLPGNRSSTYLPAGYYAAGNSTLSPTAGTFGNPRTRSMYSQNYTGPSPPESPGLPPSSRDGPAHVPHSPLESRHPSGSYNNALYPRPPGSRGNDSSAGARSSVAGTVAGGNSTSTLNLNAPPQGRAPSAYLEDLFENGTDLPGPGPDHYTPRRGRRESGSRF
ncbi:hypothetical protein UCRNP2_3921 [Neofusicoccum parvum UCRNP2]|uniref:Csi2 protein n=2 Tax=Neofusicoccum parvum TaxID=310453 RepID=R1GCL0_BOTPV|nr:hypothetical protein UCRNP2_3921 [Neofusicoccum parvum UCRNP2]GME28406.1 hypothetical protein GTA08_BOTSDO02964 [Neofusicoccum parvum]